MACRSASSTPAIRMPRQCEAGARALAQRLDLDESQWQLTFQSRFGREPWLQPYTDETLEALARARREARWTWSARASPWIAWKRWRKTRSRTPRCSAQAGGDALRYIPALNATPGHVAALAALARRHAQGWPH